MRPHEWFVHEENLKRFSSRLLSERSVDQRVLLQRLLIEEEDRFGSIGERLSRAEQMICDAQLRIDALEQAFAEDGGDPGPFRQALLASHRATLAIFNDYTERLRRDAEQCSP